MILKKIEGKNVEIRTNQIKGESIQDFGISVIPQTQSTAETTILEQTINSSGIYLLTGYVMLNNYGVQTGRNHEILVYCNNVLIFRTNRVYNSDSYTVSEQLAVPFSIVAGQKIKITIKSSIAKDWACGGGGVKILKISNN